MAKGLDDVLSGCDPCPACGWKPDIKYGVTTLREFLDIAQAHMDEFHSDKTVMFKDDSARKATEN